LASGLLALLVSLGFVIAHASILEQNPDDAEAHQVKTHTQTAFDRGNPSPVR